MSQDSGMSVGGSTVHLWVYGNTARLETLTAGAWIGHPKGKGIILTSESGRYTPADLVAALVEAILQGTLQISDADFYGIVVQNEGLPNRFMGIYDDYDTIGVRLGLARGKYEFGEEDELSVMSLTACSRGKFYIKDKLEFYDAVRMERGLIDGR